jgi:MFS family permease
MTASSFQIFVFAVLASQLIADFDVSRAILGLLGSINTVTGAVTAPWLGRLTDRIGPRRSVITVLGISGAGMSLMAIAPNLWVLGLSAIVSGLPQGWGNPSTNALIAARVPEGSRGVLTGIKQSGVQVSVFLSGLTLPTLSIWLGWRGAMWVYAGAFFALAIGVPLILAADEDDPASAASVSARDPSSLASSPPRTQPAEPRVSGPLDPLIWRIAFYALLMGTAGGAVSRFFPLWAEEVVGFSSTTAGAIVAIGGLFGVIARIAVGRLAEHRIGAPRLLGLLSLVGAVYCLSLAATTSIGSWLLWVSPVLAAVGLSAWNAVAMLTIITTVPRRDAGRASGIVMFGFLGGLSIGSPLAGLAVDAFDSYQPMFFVAFALTLASAILVLPGSGSRVETAS